MDFVAPYPNVVAEDKVIDNVVTLFRDETFQAGATAWANGGESLPLYRLISASAVPRESGDYPALFIDDIATEGLRASGQALSGTLRFNVYQWLAEPDGTEATDRLMREAIRRNLAVEAMLTAPVARATILEGFNGRAKVFVTRRDASGTVPGQASYRRYPHISVEIRFTEGP